MDNKTRISATKAFMRELIKEVLEEDRMMNEWIDFDLKMFATQGDIGDMLFKAELAGKLEAVYNKLKEKVSGGAREEAIDYFYSFIQSNRESLEEEGKGLWHNIRAKQARGEKPAHPNSKAYKDAVKAANKINSNEEVDHKPMNPGILSKDSSLKGEDGKIKISKVRAALSGMKDKNSTKAKALRRFINYHD